MTFKRPIAISLSPNAEPDDVFLALKTLFSPWIWQQDKYVKKLEADFEDLHPGYKALAFNSGRSSLLIILKSLELDPGDEVIIQAFTCVSVPDAVLWAGLKPKYADIGKDYNLNLETIKKVVSPKTRAIIVQNTFGIPTEIDSIKTYCKEHQIILIEDCAHAMGLSYSGGIQAGHAGDVALFSFGRDKILSSVFGGLVLTKNKALYTQIQKQKSQIGRPSGLWIFQQLLHPILFSLILPFYNSGFGKLMLVLFQKLHLLSRAVYPSEKRGEKPKCFPLQLGGAQAILASHQLNKLSRYNKHRQQIAQLYFNSLSKTNIQLPADKPGSVWLRFPIVTPDAKSLFQFAKSKGILLGDWYKGIIMPAIDLRKVSYTKGSCPIAEQLADNTINLPTYPLLTKGDAQKVVETIQTWIKK